MLENKATNIQQTFFQKLWTLCLSETVDFTVCRLFRWYTVTVCREHPGTNTQQIIIVHFSFANY